MHILYLHSSGYLIFKTKYIEDIGIAIHSVKKSYDDIKNFSSQIKLLMFYPFHDNIEASDNRNHIIKGNIPPIMIKVLKKFGLTSLGMLGIEFTNLTEVIKETLNIKVSSNAYVTEIIRCIRHHIDAVIKNYMDIEKDKLFRKSLMFKIDEDENISMANGFNIVNHYNLLKDFEKSIPLKTAKLRQLIQPFYPELRSIILIDNDKFPLFLSVYFDNNVKDKWESCKSFLNDNNIVALKKALKNTIGRDMSKLDSELIKNCADELIESINQCNSCKRIASDATKNLAPNLTKFLELSSGPTPEGSMDITATEIIAKAGSLKKLAEKSSTAIHTQNKRHDSLLKRGKVHNCPRSAADKCRSVQLKSLSDKCALAARRDYFGSLNDAEELDDSFGVECFERHQLRMRTWANKNAVTIIEQNKEEINQRTKKYKLKRKEKKKNWRQRKHEKQHASLGAHHSMDDAMED